MMAKTKKKGYGKLITNKNFLIYLVAAIAVYAIVYWLFVSGGLNSYNSTQTYQAPTAAVKKMTLNLAAENYSGESGKAVLTEQNGKTLVTLILTGYTAGAVQPAHIHVGACPGVGPIKYPLNNVVSGKSETTIDATISQLKSMEPLAINVHKSPQSSGIYVSCGALQ